MSAPILNLAKTTPMLDLTKAAPALKNLRGLLNWDMHPVKGASLTEGFDLDIFAFVLGSSGKIGGGQDVVFFNNKSAHGVVLPRDNRTGEGADDEEILLALDKVPADKTTIDLFVFIHDATKRNQTFGMTQNATFSLVDQDTKAVIQAYKLSELLTETSVHIGALVRNANGWGFEPYGDAGNQDPNAVAGAYA